ncbi:hypothetical protein PpBr36_03682 [Pyricularia pennisetigena]|uniref:hypothetical protein n=1 Tax=Pyricularia pennisetigena TaxID=1578925 RepID=UPI0011529589|nr:hypothetical protein PpBr36_03682 [Pyricularia pennisetigena]TLS31604.1 hypothetical protein PpBr36_03682 [Pyricularia pennisetigena]
MGSISIRKHIRWPPAPAAEPTSTIVLTSPGRRFVDLRVLLPLHSDEDGSVNQLPISRVDWAIAGTSESWIRKGVDGEDISHSRWTHWIDSRTPLDPEASVADEGDMFPQPDGTTLEKGRMWNPDVGVEADYEELWDDGEPIPGALGEDGQARPLAGGAARCIMIQMEDKSLRARGSVVLLGQYCQGLIRVGDEIAAQRWEWRHGRGWEMTIKIGELPLPCLEIIRQETDIEADQELKYGQQSWKVQESVP